MLKICKFTVIDGVQRFEICSRCTFPLPENVLKLSWYFFHTHVECGRRHFSIKFQANCSHYCCLISFKQTDEPTHMHVGAWNRFYFVAFAQEIVISVGGKKPVSVLLDQFPSPPAAPAATGAIPPRGNTVSQLSFRCWRVGGAILHALFDRGNLPAPTHTDEKSGLPVLLNIALPRNDEPLSDCILSKAKSFSLPDPRTAERTGSPKHSWESVWGVVVHTSRNTCSTADDDASWRYRSSSGMVQWLVGIISIFSCQEPW